MVWQISSFVYYFSRRNALTTTCTLVTKTSRIFDFTEDFSMTKLTCKSRFYSTTVLAWRSISDWAGHRNLHILNSAGGMTGMHQFGKHNDPKLADNKLNSGRPHRLKQFFRDKKLMELIRSIDWSSFWAERKTRKMKKWSFSCFYCCVHAPSCRYQF